MEPGLTWRCDQCGEEFPAHWSHGPAIEDIEEGSVRLCHGCYTAWRAGLDALLDTMRNTPPPPRQGDAQ